MGYIIELKLSHPSTILFADAINSLLTDVILEIYPYYIYKTHETISTRNATSIVKTARLLDEPIRLNGGMVVKKVNYPGDPLTYMRIDSDKWDVYKYNLSETMLELGMNLHDLQCITRMSNIDTITLLVDENKRDKLILILEHIEKKEKNTYTINLRQFEEYEPEWDVEEMFDSNDW